MHSLRSSVSPKVEMKGQWWPIPSIDVLVGLVICSQYGPSCRQLDWTQRLEMKKIVQKTKKLFEHTIFINVRRTLEMVSDPLRCENEKLSS